MKNNTNILTYILCLAFLLFISFVTFGGEIVNYANFRPNTVNNNDFDKFLTILARVESSGKTNAFNKSEDAIGIYQIRPDYFTDAAEYNKSLKKYSHNDCYNPEIARMVVKSYMERYCKTNNFETWAKTHNGGGRYYLNKNKQYKSNLEKYWARFQKMNY